MKKLVLGLLALAIVLMPAPPASAARVHVFVGAGCCYGPRGYYGDPYYPAYYPYGYTPYYYYAAPPPPVVYAPQQQIVYAQPAQQQSLPATQASDTYTDDSGRQCREFQSNAKIAGKTQPTYGTACLQPDGSWRVISQGSSN